MAKSVNSMEELAKIAGCSVMTVSYALRNSAQVSKATQARIQKLAKLHGYQRNPMVSALMATRRGRSAENRETIALLTKFDEPLSHWKERSGFYYDLYNGMQAKSKELGFGLEEFPTYGVHGYSTQRLNKTLTARGIRAVILMPGGGLERPFPQFDHANCCVVAAAFHARELPVHRTASDHSSAMALCLREVGARGYQRIGFALNERMDPEVRYAFSGRYLAWQRQQPEPARLPLVAGTQDLLDRDAFKAWLKAAQPDCVISSHPDCLDWICECGLKVPEDIGFALVPTRGVQHIAGVNADPGHVGEVTVNIIARELFLNHLGLPKHPETILIRCDWQEAPTLKPRPPE